MPSFQDTIKNKTDRELVGSFFTVATKNGGTFYKGAIEGHWYYLNPSKQKTDKNGNPFMILTKGEKVEEQTNKGGFGK